MNNKKIPYRKLRLAYGFLLVVGAAIMAGCLVPPRWPFFLVAAAALAACLYIHWRYLRCPHCGTWENLERLQYAVRHPFHCRGCGRLLEFDR